MIRNQEEFETALEEVIALLDAPVDQAAEDRIAHLAQCIDEYRARLDAPAEPEPMLAREREHLRRRLNDFETRWPPRSSVMTDLDAVLAPLLGRDSPAAPAD